MDKELHLEFQLLQDRAYTTLREFTESKYFIRVFSILKLPSFDPPYVWSIYSPLSNANDRIPFATFSTWRKDIDSEKFRSPVERRKYPSVIAPTIEQRSINLSKEWVATITAALSEKKISIFDNNSNYYGLDGTSYEFEYNHHFSGCTIRWHEYNTENWNPFATTISTIFKHLDDLRTKNTA